MCAVQACCVCHATLPCLSAQASHYLIPDRQLLHDFQELFESPEVANVIYLTSVLRPVSRTRRAVKPVPPLCRALPAPTLVC